MRISLPLSLFLCYCPFVRYCDSVVYFPATFSLSLSPLPTSFWFSSLLGFVHATRASLRPHPIADARQSSSHPPLSHHNHPNPQPSLICSIFHSRFLLIRSLGPLPHPLVFGCSGRPSASSRDVVLSFARLLLPPPHFFQSHEQIKRQTTKIAVHTQSLCLTCGKLAGGATTCPRGRANIIMAKRLLLLLLLRTDMECGVRSHCSPLAIDRCCGCSSLSR